MKKSIYRMVLIFCNLLMLACTVTAEEPDTSKFKRQLKPNFVGYFKDIPSDYWCFDAINELAALNIISADVDGNLKPDEPISIAELLEMAVKVREIYEGGVTSEKSNMDAASGKGIFIPDTEPDKPATRGQAASIIATALPEAFYNPAVKMDYIYDMNEKNVHTQYVAKLCRAGITAGLGERGMFLPENEITRVQAAVMMSRLIYPEKRITSEPKPFTSIVDSVEKEKLDAVVLTLDGQAQTQPLTAKWINSRYIFDSKEFSDALSLEAKAGIQSEMSLFELCEQYNLSSDWDLIGKSIHLYSGYKKPVPTAVPDLKPALIRFEDVCAKGSDYVERDDLLKLRIVADYCFEKGIVYSIAWVPVYKDPPRNYSNDILTDYSQYNVEFIFSMDYLISRGGEVILHGYTHQSGNSVSIEGSEFGGSINATEAQTRSRYQLAQKAACSLGYGERYFEFPHYSATQQQMRLAEEYFDLIYNHPGGSRPQAPIHVKNGDRTVTYIHTTLDYLVSNSDSSVNTMLNRIEQLPGTSVPALFFHPYLEFDSIMVARSGSNPPYIEYSDTSPLKRIVGKIQEKGFRFVSVETFM